MRRGAVIISTSLPELRARCPKMALDPSGVGRRNSVCTEPDGFLSEGGEPPKKSTATSAIAKQNGDPTGCGDSVMPEHEASERRRSTQADPRHFSSSPLPGQRPNFQIPRKTRERKGGVTSLQLRTEPVQSFIIVLLHVANPLACLSGLASLPKMFADVVWSRARQFPSSAGPRLAAERLVSAVVRVQVRQWGAGPGVEAAPSGLSAPPAAAPPVPSPSA